MDRWVPPPKQPWPRGSHTAWTEGYRRGPWPPPPYSRHNNEWMYHHEPWPGLQLNAQVEYHHPAHHSAFMRPNSGAEYYESSYPNWPHSRQGYEDLNRRLVEDYTYGSAQRYPQAQHGERDRGERDTWGKGANSWIQNYSGDYHPSSGFVGRNDLTPMRSKQHVSYEDSYGLKKNDSSEINYSSHLQPYQIQNDLQGNFLENATIPAHEVPFVEEPNLLQQYKDSGLSSSTYELSQYISDSSNHYEAAPSKDWSPIQGCEVFKAINLWDEEDREDKPLLRRQSSLHNSSHTFFAF